MGGILSRFGERLLVSLEGWKNNSKDLLHLAIMPFMGESEREHLGKDKSITVAEVDELDTQGMEGFSLKCCKLHTETWLANILTVAWRTCTAPVK